MSEGVKLGLTLLVVVLLFLDFCDIFDGADPRVRAAIKILLGLGLLVRKFGGQGWPFEPVSYAPAWLSEYWPFLFVALLFYGGYGNIRKYLQSERIEDAGQQSPLI